MGNFMTKEEAKTFIEKNNLISCYYRGIDVSAKIDQARRDPGGELIIPITSQDNHQGTPVPENAFLRELEMEQELKTNVAIAAAISGLAPPLPED